MTFRSRLSGVVAAGVLSVSCSTVTDVEAADRRLALENLTAPTTAVSTQPFPVEIRYEIGACDEVTAVSGQISGGNRLEIEVRGLHVPPPGGGCPDILLVRDTTLTVIAPQPGLLSVIGLQPQGAPIERTVTVTDTQ